MKHKAVLGQKIICLNRKASFNYFFIEILEAGISLKGSTLYVYGLPVCHDCAKGIIQVGINRIVMAMEDIPQKWLDSFEKSRRMFDESGVLVDFMNDTVN